MKDYIETQYKNLDFTIPDDYVSRREVYAMLDYIGGQDSAAKNANEDTGDIHQPNTVHYGQCQND